MLQIFKKDNSGFWTDIRAQHKALAATRPPIAEEQLDDSQGAADAALGLGLSEGSLENSLFGDRSWGGKLSYSRMRAALDTMAAFGQTPGKGGGRRFSLSSSGGSFRGSSFRAGSLFGRRGSLDSAGNADNSEGSGAAPVPLTTFRRFFCCLCGPRRGTRNHSSKLNQVLSSMDESAAATAVGPGTRAPSSSTTYYPPASFRAEDNNGNGGKISRPSVVDDVASSFSASGAAGSVAGNK